MIRRYEYRGYAFADETTVTDDGRYFARAIVTTLGNGRVPSQRFIDLETFRCEEDAGRRVVEAARAWIDDEIEQIKDRLSLPTNFCPLR